VKEIGSFESKQFGKVTVLCGVYERDDGPMAIQLMCNTDSFEEPLAKLSVNMYRPECSHDSRDLPVGCFYAKTYGENELIAGEALASGLFRQRDDLPKASSGWVEAPAWELVAQ